jgi:signal transduction histidine kinase
MVGSREPRGSVAGRFASPMTRIATAVGIGIAGLVAGAIAGRRARAADRRTISTEYELRLADLDHDLRAPMTIIRGEVELVLSQDDIPVAERQRSIATIIAEFERLERRLARGYRA